jgi:carbon starvation protein
MRLPQMIGGFVEGGANVLSGVGIPVTLGIGIMAVLVACFAATTLDTATRLQRYVISELGGAIGSPVLQNKYVATGVAVVTGGALAMIPGAAGPGSGGLILWPIFGATNQLLAGLSFIVIAFYLIRLERPVWFLAAPLLLMLILPNWAMVVQMGDWWSHPGGRQWTLLIVGGTISALEIWMIIEAALLWGRVRGIAPEPLPALT